MIITTKSFVQLVNQQFASQQFAVVEYILYDLPHSQNMVVVRCILYGQSLTLYGMENQYY